MRKTVLSLSALVVSGLLAVTAVSNAFSLYMKGANDASFSFGQGLVTHKVRFYTGYSSSWDTFQDISVSEGSPISTAVNPTQSGYTFEGWTTSEPTLDSHDIQYTTTQVNALVIDSDINFYPIFKSTDKKVYTNSNNAHHYYNIDEDIVIDYQTLKETTYGHYYLGFNGIPNPESSWHDDRDLITPSGIYKFFDVDGGLNIKRKVGVIFTGSIWNNEGEWEHYKINLFKGTDSWTSYVEGMWRGTDNTKDKVMSFYVQYQISNIQFLRLDGQYTTQWNYSNKTSFTGYTSSNWIVSNKNASSWDGWSGAWVAKDSSSLAASDWGLEGGWESKYDYHL